MARTVKDYMDIVKQVRDNIPNETEKILNQNKNEVLDLNRNTLFEDGENNNGEVIGTYKISVFGSGKGYPKIRGTRFNFFDTGNFFRGFDFLFRNNKISIFSRDTKSQELQDKYGSDIFGLNKDNQEILNEKILKPALWNYLKRYL